MFISNPFSVFTTKPGKAFTIYLNGTGCYVLGITPNFDILIGNRLTETHQILMRTRSKGNEISN
tara:strand:- start:124 stop:315 length:192 start_codon:yes stop_codon:yes gene_type:complete